MGPRFICVVALQWTCAGSTLDGLADETTAAAAKTTGSIEGTVTYRADSKRPWRYARYYVKQAKTGELAEAVVALRGKTLAGNKPRPAQIAMIDQKNFLFVPETTAIRAGDSITFTNSDGAAHNVQVSSDLVSFSATMTDGGSHTEKFPRAGGIHQPLVVGCSFHSAMRAYIFVFDHPYYQVTGPDGRFQLNDVPPGEYELELVHAAGELRSRQRVVVKAGNTLRVDIGLSPDDKR